MTDPTQLGEVAERLLAADRRLSQLDGELARLAEAAAAIQAHREGVAEVSARAADLLAAIRSLNAEVSRGMTGIAETLEAARDGLAALEEQAGRYDAEQLMAEVREQVSRELGSVESVTREEVKRGLAELEVVMAETREIADRLRILDPASLLATLDDRARDLENFRRSMQPVKERIEEFVVAVGGRDGQVALAEEVRRIRRVQRLQLLLLLLTVLVTLGLLASSAAALGV